LVFTSNRGGSPQIYKIDALSGRVERLTFRGSYNARAQTSPDGHDLVMVHRENGQFHISVQNLQRDLFANLTKTSLDESPSISPNGSMVIYATQHKNMGVLGAVAINGNIKYLLPAHRGEVREPVWSPYLN
jgi:TolB protein